MKVNKIDYHRNGVCGAGFFVGLIEDEDKSTKLFVHFPDHDEDGYVKNGDSVMTAILDADLVGKHVTEFMVNSWRGDHYHDLVVDKIMKDEKDDRRDQNIHRSATKHYPDWDIKKKEYVVPPKKRTLK